MKRYIYVNVKCKNLKYLKSMHRKWVIKLLRFSIDKYFPMNFTEWYETEHMNIYKYSLLIIYFILFFHKMFLFSVSNVYFTIFLFDKQWQFLRYPSQIFYFSLVQKEKYKKTPESLIFYLLTVPVYFDSSYTIWWVHRKKCFFVRYKKKKRNIPQSRGILYKHEKIYKKFFRVTHDFKIHSES